MLEIILLILISLLFYIYFLNKTKILESRAKYLLILKSFISNFYIKIIHKKNRESKLENNEINSAKIEELEKEKSYKNTETKIITNTDNLNIEETEQEKKIRLRDEELDELMYDDVFRYGMQMILCVKRKLDMYDIKMLMDHNGYFGRYKIIPIHEHGKYINEIKIEVYMVDSQMSYTWPYKSTFSMEKGDIKSTKYLVKNDYSRSILAALVGLSRDRKPISYYYVSKFVSNYRKSVVNPILDKIINMELGNINECIKTKSERDAYEIYANLICYNFNKQVSVWDPHPFLI